MKNTEPRPKFAGSYKIVLFFQAEEDGGEVYQKNKPGKCYLVVKVTDVDDNKPVFLKQHYIVNVKEHQVIDTVVLKVTAVDADEVPACISKNLICIRGGGSEI